MTVSVEIINIGDELLIGQVVNTNASWMGSMLSNAGFDVRKIMAISDNEEEIEMALEESIGKIDVVLMSGGLGPTKDDITKKVLSKYFQSEMYFHKEAFVHIQELFKARGFQVSELNKKQAYLPTKAKAIPNRNGTAYGMWFEQKNTIVIAMPGVPFEMKTMMENEILPRLISKFQPQEYAELTLMTTGLGESFLAQKIEEIETKLPKDMKLAYLPRPGIVRLRLSIRGVEKQKLEKELQITANQIIEVLGKNVVYGYNEDALEQVLGNLLMRNSLTMATAESCTGGKIAHKITSVAGSSAYFQASIVSYSNEAKNHYLAVKSSDLEQYGAVSEQVVLQMAKGARKALKVDYAVASSGIAGPDGGTSEKPVGYTWLAVAGPYNSIAILHQFGEHRGRNIERASLAALNMLRIMILEDKSS